MDKPKTAKQNYDYIVAAAVKMYKGKIVKEVKPHGEVLRRKS